MSAVRPSRRGALLRPLLALAATTLAACSVTIDGERAERDRAEALGGRYRAAFAERKLPVPAAAAPLADWIACAESANGELEAAWHAWLAALDEVPEAAAQDTTAMLGVQHRLDGGKALDRSALQLMSDAMNNLLLPGRLRARGQAALARARTAGAAFVQARLRVQRTIAERYHALARHRVEIALQQRLRQVLAVAVPSLRARAQAGQASQQELLMAEIALVRADAELARMHGEHDGHIAELRAAAGLDREGPLPAPALESFAPLTLAEDQAIERALAHAPDLELRRREHDAALAEVAATEWRRVPEFSLQAMLAGDGMVQLAGAVTLPFLRDDAIEGAIRAATARSRAAAAMLRQTATDATARVLTLRAGLRAYAAERDLLLQEQQKVTQLGAIARAAWGSGQGPFADFAAAEAMAIELDRRLALLEGLAAVARARLDEALGGLEQR